MSDRSGKPGKRRKCIAVMAVVLSILGIWTVWGNTALMKEEFRVGSDRLPAAFAGFRIAHISDLHNAEFGEGNEELLGMIAESDPDIIVITGDLVDSRRTDIEVAVHFAGECARIAPTYYVPGNHEAAIRQYGTLKEGLEAAGVFVLEDNAVRLRRDGEEILLAGLADPDFTVRGDLFGEVPAMVATKLKALTGGENLYTILLSHRPELFEVYAAGGVDLVLSGHAHGGQFRLPFIGGLAAPGQGLFPKYDAGLFRDGATNMIVSRGLGNSIIPIRFNNRPEVVLVELESFR